MTESTNKSLPSTREPPAPALAAVPPSAGEASSQAPAEGTARRTVGEILRRTREEYGEDLKAVATTLRINWTYLDGLERGDYTRLPGRVYIVGWVRTYAEYLGLDATALLDQFRAEENAPSARQDLNFPEPQSEGRAPGIGVIIASVLLLGLVYAGYYAFSERTASGPETPTQTATAPVGATNPAGSAPAPSDRPQQIAAPSQGAQAPVAAGSGAAPAGPSVAQVPGGQLPGSRPAPGAPQAPAASTRTPSAGNVSPIVQLTPPAPPQRPSVLPQQAAAPTAPTAPGQAENTESEPGGPADPKVVEGLSQTLAGQVAALPPPVVSSEREPVIYGEENADSRIFLSARAKTWFEVLDHSGKRVFSRELQVGDVYRVPNAPNLRMRIGNAGGLQVIVDGRQAPDIGPSGSVRSNVKLDPQLLLTGQAYAPPPRPATPAGADPSGAPAAAPPAPGASPPAAAPKSGPAPAASTGGAAPASRPAAQPQRPPAGAPAAPATDR
ncbi:MAG: DUF4115 domain-containing protein [Alphaproteobacteria bacterium]|nr:DUF4115 domain-containing protein [Alphaproteobacteria bacterium]